MPPLQTVGVKKQIAIARAANDSDRLLLFEENQRIIETMAQKLDSQIQVLQNVLNGAA